MRIFKGIAICIAALLFMTAFGVTAFADEENTAEHTVTFISDGVILDSRTVPEGGDLGALPEDPEKDGYTFFGWANTADNYNSIENLSPYSEVTEDRTYYAFFTKDVTLTFLADGVVYDTIRLTANPATGASQEAAYPPSDEPDKEGYLFKGWYTKGGEAFRSGVQVRKDTVYYASFEKLGTVTFYVDDVVFEEQTFERSGAYYRPVEPAAPVLEGYIFVGWYKDEDFSVRANFQAEYVRDDTSYFAKMVDEEERLGTVTFYVDDEVYEEQYFETGTGLYSVFEPTAPEMEDYIFAGWYKDEEFKNRATFPVNVRENTEFYALFAEIGTVTFMLDDEVFDEQTFMLDGSPYTPVEPDVPYTEGFVFDGWFKDENFSRRAAFPTAVREDTTYYGRFSETGSVLFMVDDEIYVEQTFSLGRNTFTVTEPEPPVLEGREFEGWYTDPSFAQKVRFPVQIRQSTEYYARFEEEKQQVYVTFMIDGEVFEEQTLMEGDTVEGSATLYPKNGAFDGWYLDEECLMPAVFPVLADRDLTFYGTMREQATVTFMVDGEIYREETFVKNGTYYLIAEPQTPEKQGSSFKGWFEDEKYRNEIHFPLQVKDSIVIYGTFSNSTLTGTVFSGGTIVLVIGMLLLFAAAIYMVLRKQKPGKKAGTGRK